MKARVFFYRGYLQGLFIVLLITYVWAYLTYLHSQPPGNSTAYLQALPRSPNLTRQHFMRHAALRLVLLSILLAFITQAIVTPVRRRRRAIARSWKKSTSASNRVISFTFTVTGFITHVCRSRLITGVWWTSRWETQVSTRKL